MCLALFFINLCSRSSRFRYHETHFRHEKKSDLHIYCKYTVDPSWSCGYGISFSRNIVCSFHRLTQVAAVCSKLCHHMDKDVISLTVLTEKGIWLSNTFSSNGKSIFSLLTFAKIIDLQTRYFQIYLIHGMSFESIELM